MGARRRLAETALWLIIFLVASGTLLLTMLPQISVYDEGTILTGAFRILHGEWPSRDFYTSKGPAQFFLLAAIFRLFGMNVLVARIYDSLVAGGIVVLSATAVRQVTRSPLLPATCALAVALALVHRSVLASTIPSIFLLIFGGTLLAKRIADGALPWSYLSIAITVAALFLFRYDVAALAIAALGTPFLYLVYVDFRQGNLGGRESIRLVLGNILLLCACLAVVVAGLVSAGILVPALRDILTYNTANYVRMRSLPFPGAGAFVEGPSKAMAVYFPLIASAFAIIVLIVRSNAKASAPLFSTASRRRRDASLIIFLSMTLFCTTQGLVRTDTVHMLISDVPAMILAAVSLDTLDESIPSKKASRLLNTALLAVFAMALVAVIATVRDRSIADFAYRRFARAAPAEPSALSIFLVDPNVRRAIEFIASRTAATDRILSTTGRHDKILINDVSSYFLAQRLPGTRWAIYDPGVQTSERVQKEMIGDIERYRVKYIVQNRTWDDVMEDNESARSSGVTILDDHIRRSFREVRAFGNVSVLERIKL